MEQVQKYTAEESARIHQEYLGMIKDKQLNLTDVVLDERASQGILSQDLDKSGKPKKGQG